MALTVAIVGAIVALTFWKRNQVEIPFHRGSETFSFWSHGISMMAAMVGLVWMILQVDGPKAITAVSVYGASMILLFFSSTAHHAVQSAKARERSGFMRRLDHIAIFVFIAGTYTPVCLLALPPAWGISILSVVGGLALLGVGLKLFAPFSPKWVTVTLYVGLGWIAVVGIVPLVNAFPLTALGYLFAGGVVYTAGAVGYAKHWPNLWPKWLGAHGVWHVMVMIAAALHFVFVTQYVLSS